MQSATQAEVQSATQAKVQSATQAEVQGATQAEVQGATQAQVQGATQAQVQSATLAEVQAQVHNRNQNQHQNIKQKQKQKQALNATVSVESARFDDQDYLLECYAQGLRQLRKQRVDMMRVRDIRQMFRVMCEHEHCSDRTNWFVTSAGLTTGEYCYLKVCPIMNAKNSKQSCTNKQAQQNLKQGVDSADNADSADSAQGAKN